MNTLPRTDYHEAFGPHQEPSAAVQEAIDWSFTADDHQNELLKEEMRKHLVFPQFEMPAMDSDGLVQEPSEDTKVQDNEALADEILQYMTQSVSANVLPALLQTPEKKLADPVAENYRIMPSFFSSSNEKPGDTSNIQTTLSDDNDDFLVWKDLGHIKDGTSKEEHADDSLVWVGLGHIKDHESELARQKEDEKLLRQVDAVVAMKGLVRLMKDAPESFKARTLALDAPAEPDTSFTQEKSMVVTPEPTENDDFDDWKNVLAANTQKQNDDKEFWAETELAANRRERIRELGKKAVVAAVIAVSLLPGIQRVKSTFSTRRAPVVLAATPGVIPSPEFATTSSIPQPETTTTIIIPVSSPAASLAQIAAETIAAEQMRKDAAEKAQAEEAAAKVPEKKAETLDQLLASVCDSSEITSDFGVRVHPVTGEIKMHTGIDIGCDENTPFYAPKPGKVIYAGWLAGYGNTVIVDHGTDANGDELTTLYGHANAINVHVGQEVTDESLGLIGKTGDATGPHMHWETQLNGTAVNPRSVLNDFQR